MSNSTFIEEEQPKGFWQERYEELREKYDQLLKSKNVPDDIEYIRKDALLEWAKEKYNEYKQMDEDFQGDVFIGNRHAFAEVIAKIESL